MSKFDQYPVTRLFTDSPAPAGADFALHVDAGSSLSEVFVIDGGFNMVARGQGHLDTRLPKGEYLLKYRAGDNLKETWIQLDRDQRFGAYDAPLPPTAAPISERAGWSPAESSFAEGLRGGYALSIVIRDDKRPPPIDDVRVLDRDGGLIARLTAPPSSGWKRDAAGQAIGIGGSVAPGGYLLMVSTPGLRPYAMPLWVAPNCSTQVFMERQQLGIRGKRRKGPHLASASIFIASNRAGWDEIKRLIQLTETAKSVLSYDRAIVPRTEEIQRALDEKFLCPILGLLAAHLLRIRYEELPAKADAQADTLRRELEAVVENLKRLMPGSPDVGALEFALGRKGEADFGVPPMLAHSWAILQQLGASAIPSGSYADRIRTAVCATRPWLVFNKSKMIPRATGPSPRKKAGGLALLSPALREAARRLGKGIQVGVDATGRVTLKRK